MQDTQEMWGSLIPGSGKISWCRKWQPAPVFLLGKLHGQRSLAGAKTWTWLRKAQQQHGHSIVYYDSSISFHLLPIKTIKQKDKIEQTQNKLKSILTKFLSKLLILKEPFLLRLTILHKLQLWAGGKNKKHKTLWPWILNWLLRHDIKCTSHKNTKK